MAVYKRIFIFLAILVGIGLIVVIYYQFNPATVHIFPSCPFLKLTGWKCPGCGSQRALHALLHLDMAHAFHYNAFLVLSLPVLLLLAYAEAVRKHFPSFYTRVQRPLYIWIYFFLTIWWGIGRNLWGV